MEVLDGILQIDPPKGADLGIPCARHVWAEAPDLATLDVLWQAIR